MKRMDYHLRFLDDAMKLRAESSCLDSQIKDIKASNAALVNEIQSRMEKETKGIFERIDYLGNCCQEWSHSAVAHLPKFEDNENDEANNDYESSGTQSTISSSCFRNESVEPNLHHNEIQSSFSKSHEDNYSISTSTTVSPTSPSKVNHSSEEADDNHSNSAQSIPHHDAEPFPKPTVYIPKTPRRNLTSIQLKSIQNLPVRCTLGVPPSSANSCVQAILGNGGSFIPKDHVPAGFPITYYDAASKPPKMDRLVGHVRLPVRFPNAAYLSRDKHNMKILEIWIQLYVVDFSAKLLLIDLSALKSHGINFKQVDESQHIVLTNIPNDRKDF